MSNFEKKASFFKFTTLLLLAIILSEFLFSKKLLNYFCPKPQEEITQKAKPSATTQIEKSFEFPIKKNSKEKFKINITKAEKVKLVTTKNQPVAPKEGEEFLLVYLEVENNLETPITIDSQNYIRLIDENDKKLAPDFYNGPIQILPISTKKDQIGFVVKEGQNEFKLQVGEPEGKKEQVEFKF